MKLSTPLCLLSYPHLVEPRAMDASQQAMYSCAFVFPPAAQKTPEFKALVEAIDKAGLAKFGDKWPVIRKAAATKLPLHDGSEKGYPEGSVYLNARTKDKPDVLWPFADPATGRAKLMTDEEAKREMFAGAHVYGALSVYGFEKAGARGVGVGLIAVQLMRNSGDDVKRLDGRVPGDQLLSVKVEGTAPMSIEDAERDIL